MTIRRIWGHSLWLAAIICTLVWPLRTVQADMVGHGGMVRAIALSPDGGRVLTASFDYTVKLWDFVEQKLLATLDGHDGQVNDAVFHPNGIEALSAGGDGMVIRWRLPAGEPVARLEGHAFPVVTVAVSSDGRHAASGDRQGRLIYWDLASNRQLLAIETKSALTAVAFGSGDKTLIAGFRDGRLGLYRLPDGAAQARLRFHDLGLTSLTVARKAGRILSVGLDGRVRIWDLAGLAMVNEFLPFEASNPYVAALSPDGKWLIAANRGGALMRIDMSRSQPPLEIKAHQGPIWSLVVSVDGRFALSGGADERVRVWHLATGDRISATADDPSDERPRPWLKSKHAGARLFRKCARCHALNAKERKRSGPHLAGLFGRRAGAVSGYRYSAALTGKYFVWSAETLKDLFRDGPDKYLPGTKMPVQRIGDEAQLDALVDYLLELTKQGG